LRNATPRIDELSHGLRSSAAAELVNLLAVNEKDLVGQFLVRPDSLPDALEAGLIP